MRNDKMLQVEMTVSDARLVQHAITLWLEQRAKAFGERRITGGDYARACDAHDRITQAIVGETS